MNLGGIVVDVELSGTVKAWVRMKTCPSIVYERKSDALFDEINGN